MVLQFVVLLVHQLAIMPIVIVAITQHAYHVQIEAVLGSLHPRLIK
jgi:hypothetical protein